MKRCARCKSMKPFSQFFRRRNKTTFKSYCKPCQADFCREYYYANHELYNKRRLLRNKKYRLRNRSFVWQYLTKHPCLDCGERDPIVLEFDHVTGRKVQEVSIMVGQAYPLARIEAEILKCEVRCANCHRRRTAKQLGWKRDPGCSSVVERAVWGGEAGGSIPLIPTI
jgi:hypothetical protein